MNSEDLAKVYIANAIENIIVIVACVLVIYITGSLWGLFILLCVGGVKLKKTDDKENQDG